jgi:alkyldihydroxyacetonephosphate synthase
MRPGNSAKSPAWNPCGVYLKSAIRSAARELLYHTGMNLEPAQIRWNGWGLAGHDDALAAREPVWRWLTSALNMPALLATPPRALSDCTLPPSRLDEAARTAMIALLGAERVRQDDYSRAAHALGRGIADLLRLRAGDLSASPDAVLYPRHEDDVLAVLRLCAMRAIAVVPYDGGTGAAGGVNPARGEFKSIVTLDMAQMNRVTAIDTVSGVAQVEAGITAADLTRALAARGLMIAHEAGEFSTVGGWIAGGDDVELHGLRAATTDGIVTSSLASTLLRGSNGALGVITAASVRVRAIPAVQAHHDYLFPDFAAGLMMLREDVPHTRLSVSDAGATRWRHILDSEGKPRDTRALLGDLYRAYRRFDGNAARLTAEFSGDEDDVKRARQRLDTLAKKLGAIAVGNDPDWQNTHRPYWREALLDRGAAMDCLEIAVEASKLPVLYAALRTSLREAMRRHAPREGAHGLVLADVRKKEDGLRLRITWLFARILGDDVAQAQAIRRAALDVLAAQGVQDDGADILRAVKRTLDPSGILNPGKLA